MMLEEESTTSNEKFAFFAAALGITVLGLAGYLIYKRIVKMREKHAHDQSESEETTEERDEERTESEIDYNDPIRKDHRRTSLVER